MAAISEMESKRRERVVSSSVGSLAMEGQQLDAVTVALNQRYVNGDLTLEEFSEAVERHVQELARSLQGESLAHVA